MEVQEQRAKLTNELMKQRQNKLIIQNFDDTKISTDTKSSVIRNIDTAISQIQEDIRKLDGNRELQ